ncbi:MAG: DNA-binding domain-containing protein [Flavimaricola sp.]|nr:DNA-binding domain-containing protein [Flavimaricola sp.]
MTVQQADFTAALLDPTRAAPPGLSDGAGRPAGKRYDVYRNNVVVALSDALETAFPVIRKLLGDQFFRAMAGVYVRAHPPASPLMMHYGADFPTFLAGFPPAQGLPYLPDVARVELALRRAYHAADAAPIAATALAEVPPDRLGDIRLSFAPAVSLIPSDYPIHGIWTANAMGGPNPKPVAESALVARPGLDPSLSLITPGTLPVLTALMSGATLGDALDLAGDGFDLSALLSLLLSQGAITALN